MTPDRVTLEAPEVEAAADVLVDLIGPHHFAHYIAAKMLAAAQEATS